MALLDDTKKREIIKNLKRVKASCQEAIDGEWDVRGDGIPLSKDAIEGFEAMIDDIDDTLKLIR